MSTLAEIAPAFVTMAHRIVWCVVATLDAEGQPRTRVLHPLWEWDGERLQGWIATGRTPVKAAGLDATPHVSLTYWDRSHDTCTADCRAEWVPGAEKADLWNRFVDAPAPVGYDPALIPDWADGPDSPAFDGLVLDPFRLRLMPGALMTTGQGELLTWRK